MTSLASFLPAPKHTTKIRATVVTQTTTTTLTSDATTPPSLPANSNRKRIPRYGQRKGYTPREPEDFGDGGAFPEIHIAQYPLNMGRKKSVASHTQVVALATDATGEAQFDVIVQSSDKYVNSKHSQLVPAQHLITQTELQKPDDDAVRDVTERTRLALERKLQGKANVTPLATAEAAAATHGNAPTFLSYTPATVNGVAQQTRIVKMVSAPVDPLEPPKFRHRKTIKAEGDAPVPVMHSPPRHVTAEDQLAWKIPPCISNWKNTKGYTIPLDKRLAADGRGLQEVTINDNFAKFAESLYIAEAASREEVAKRAAIQRKLAVNEKEATEDALRRLAAEARMKRAGLASGADDHDNAPSADDVTHQQRGAIVRNADSDNDDDGDNGSGQQDANGAVQHDDPEKAERDRIRAERRRERERQIRMEAMGNRKSKLTRDDERDVSERIALGMQASSGTKETQYDQRLFNQSQGMTSGFGDDEAYNIFDGPLMKRGDAAKHIYRPTANKDEAISAAEADAEYANLTKTDKFQPAKGFNGTETDGQPRVARDGPVQFEKQAEEDPFGLDSFLLGAKNSSSSNNKDDDRSSRKRTFDDVGKRGHLAAAGGGNGESSGRSRVEFDDSKRARR